MLIYANKQDLISALSAEEIEELLCLGMINDRAWTIVACSAKEKEGMDCYSTLMCVFVGLQEGIDWLIQNIDM